MLSQPTNTGQDTPLSLDLFRSKLAESAIPQSYAKQNGLSYIKPNGKTPPAMLIPYKNAQGKPTAMRNLRWLKQPYPNDRKYQRPPGLSPRVYFPLMAKPWKEIIGDPTIQIMITEGELKALSAASHGIACVGLSGVDTGVIKKKLVADLAQFEWTQRKVSICFDADTQTNVSVRRATETLAAKLLALGARVEVMELPPDAGPKTGIDDFLRVHEGDVTKLADIPRREVDHAELYAMNEEFAVVHSPVGILRIADGTILSTNEFRLLVSDRPPIQIGETQHKPPRPKMEPLGSAWLSFEHRSSVYCMTFDPTREPNSIIDVDGVSMFNVFKGWRTVPKKGSVKPFLDLVRFIFGKETEAMKWFLQWLAWPVQHPGRTMKMDSAVLLLGAGGTGKTFLGDCAGSVYGDGYARLTQHDLISNFNKPMQHALFVHGEEIGDAGGRTPWQIADTLKGLITKTMQSIEPKFVDRYEVPAMHNFLFSSNHANAIKIDANERRYLVIRVPDKKREREFYIDINKWLHGDEYTRGTFMGPGAAALHHYLLRVDTSNFDPLAQPPDTEARNELIDVSKTNIDAYLEDILEGRAVPYLDGKGSVKQTDLWTAAEISAVLKNDHDVTYPPRRLVPAQLTPRGIYPLRGKDYKFNVGTTSFPISPVRLYPVRNPERWHGATIKDVVAEYRRARGLV